MNQALAISVIADGAHILYACLIGIFLTMQFQDFGFQDLAWDRMLVLVL